MLDFSLDGKVAIITGGSKGLGLAIAHGFVEAGASVSLAARGEETLNHAVKEVEEAGGKAIGIRTDVTERRMVRNLVEQTVDAFGTVDILVNSAGVAPFYGEIDRISMSRFEHYFAINFMGAVYAIRAVAPILLGKKSGCVLNMTSLAGFIAYPGVSYYSTAKAAMINLTRTVASEWAASGVRVNAIAPGAIATDMNARVRGDPDLNQGILRTIPMGRWGGPLDVVGPAVFMCSAAAGWLTGVTLIVDGGQSTSSVLTM